MNEFFVKSRRELPALLALAFLSLAMTYPLVFHPSDRVPSDLRDPLYTMWVLNWDVRAAGAGFAHFADANIFYPHRGTLFYADALPGLAALGAPILLLSGNPVLTYNVLFILSFFLGGLGMFLLVKHLTSSRNAGFLAGVIFAFFPYHFAHLSHLELLFCCWMPFCFLFIHRFFEKPSIKNLAGIAVFYALQVLSCAYYGAYLTLFSGLAGLYFALKQGDWRKGRFWGKMAILAAVCGGILFPYFSLISRIHARMLFTRPMWEVKLFSAELQHYLAVPSINIAWGWLTGRLGAQEWQLFPGLVPIFLTAFWLFKTRPRQPAAPERPLNPKKKPLFILWDVLNVLVFCAVLGLGLTGGFDLNAGLFKITAHHLDHIVIFLLISLCSRALLDPRIRSRLQAFSGVIRSAEKVYLFMLVSAWLLSFGPVIRCLGREIVAGPYNLLFKWVPGFQNLRVPSRFAVMLMVGLSVLSGWGALRILDRWKSARGKNRAAAAIGALILLEYLSVPVPLVPVPVNDRIPRIYAAVEKLPKDAALIELPMPAHDHEEYEEAPAVYYSIYHKKAIVNGYSGYSPPGYRVVREAMEQFPSEETFRLLEDLGVDHMVVHTDGYRGERGRDIVERLKDFSSRAGLVADANGDYLYRLIVRQREAAADEGLRTTGDRTKWRARASLNQNTIGLATDGDIDTGWSTGFPQRKDDFFELDLGEIVPMKKIILHLNNNPLDFPRSFRVEGSADGKAWRNLYEKTGFFPALDSSMIEDFRRYVVPIPFAAAAVRYIRITLTAAHEVRHWSINEISIMN
jgi:hypothetical protein